jgi:hypothetical protein
MANVAQRGLQNVPCARGTGGALVPAGGQKRGAMPDAEVLSATCLRCGAWRGELGNESIPDCLSWARGEPPCPACFICHLRTVFAAVKRVLRDDGLCFVVLGDSYSGGKVGNTNGGPSSGLKRDAQRSEASRQRSNDVLAGHLGGMAFRKPAVPGIPPKSLLLVPERFRLAMAADGWVVRSVIRWVKKSCMPESVTDRFTSAVEDVVMLAKGPRYYSDFDAIREPISELSVAVHGRYKAGGSSRTEKLTPVRGDWDRGLRNGKDRDLAAGRNPRNWVLLGPEPLAEPHFAAFVTKLVDPLVRCSTSQAGQCGRCGSPWRRVVEKQANGRVRERSGGGLGTAIRREPLGLPPVGGTFQEGVTYQTTGWQPTCSCNLPESENVPQTILDIFCGSGTTGVVAARLGRSFVGIELNPSYVELSIKRIREEGSPLFSGPVESDAPEAAPAAAQAALW